MKTISRSRFLSLTIGTLTALAVPARGDVIDDLRRCDHVWVERIDVSATPVGGIRSRADRCNLIDKRAGDLAMTVNPRRFGLPADIPIRMIGTVQPAGWVRWTVDAASVPRRAGGFDIRSLTGSIDTDVRAIGPFESDCDGTTHTYRVRLDLRPNRSATGENLNRLVLDAGLIIGPLTVAVDRLGAELGTPARAALTLSSVTMSTISVRGAPDRATRVSGTVWVSAAPDGRTYNASLSTRGSPMNAGIRLEPAAMRFTGSTLYQSFTLTAPAAYYGSIEVTGTGEDGTVRRATVRVADPNSVFDRVVVPPEGRRVYPWDYRPDPPPDVLRSPDPARKLTAMTPIKPGQTFVPPAGKASIPTPQEPFAPKAGAAQVPPVVGKPAGGKPLPPAFGRGPKG